MLQVFSSASISTSYAINRHYLLNESHSTILRDTSTHKSAFSCHYNTGLENIVWSVFGALLGSHKP